MASRLRPFLLALALIATACGLRWPGLGKTIWNLDEGSTFTMAEVVRNGGVLYRDAADNRTPLVPYAKALILSAVGDWNIRGAHIVMAILLGLTAVWLWRLGRRAGDELAGGFAAVYFTLLSFVMLGAVDAMAAHTGWFLVFFSALGMWAFVAALQRGSAWRGFAAGSAFAFAALAKQPGLLDWGVCLVICVLVAWSNPARARECTRLAAMLALGFAGPLAATYGYFAAHGAWHDLVQYSWTYNTQLYVPEVPFRERLLGIRMPLHLARENATFAYWLGVAGAGWLLGRALPDLWRRPKAFPVLPWLILGWSATGLLSTVLSGRDFAHYSIQVLPGLSLACGWVTARCWEVSAGWRTRGSGVARWLLRAALGLGLLSLGWTAIRRASTFDLSDGISHDIGLVIKDRTRPDERIFVWGYEPELHVFSERLPNTRFIYAVFLTGLIPWTNLDALKNTDYAIVPGAWDAFWHDFTLRPPAMIVDTRGNRGFLKYPLRRQTRLWNLIEKEYVEVAVDYAAARGYVLYQRAATAPAANLTGLAGDDRLQLSAPAKTSPGTLKVRVDAPDGIIALDLYLDGRPYRRLDNPGRQAVQTGFTVLEADLGIGNHVLRAIARKENGDLASADHPLVVEPATAAARRFAGPPLAFNGHDYLPVESETITGEPVSLQGDNGQWEAHAPSRLVYLRPPGMTRLEFTCGIRPGAFDGSNPQTTDGVDVSVLFEDDNGRQTQLYRRNIDPVRHPPDRSLVTGAADLPGLAGGRIIMLMTPGPMNNPAFDWSFWRRVTGDPTPVALGFRGQIVAPVEREAKLGLNQMDYGTRKVLLAHAPAHFAFPALPGMSELTGEFGLLDEAWQGPQKTDGAIFEIEQVLPDGTRKKLFSQTLYPANKPSDRGVQSFRVGLGYLPGALIRLSTRPANPGNNSFNYTFWHGLTANEFSAHLAFGPQEIRSIGSEAIHGLAYLDEEGATVLFAHAPSQIIFPPVPGARRLEGSIGLIRAAYTGKGDTQGAVFVVEAEAEDGKRRELFRRHLNPRAAAADQGAVPFSVAVSGIPASDRLVLRTEGAPSGSIAFGWSYWRDLRLVP